MLSRNGHQPAWAQVPLSPTGCVTLSHAFALSAARLSSLQIRQEVPRSGTPHRCYREELGGGLESRTAEHPVTPVQEPSGGARATYCGCHMRGLHPAPLALSQPSRTSPATNTPGGWTDVTDHQPGRTGTWKLSSTWPWAYPQGPRCLRYSSNLAIIGDKDLSLFVS